MTDVTRQFNDLLEAEWEGRLDESGRLQLEALCTADAMLAERLRRERRLRRMLSAAGPNTAPAGLAREVLRNLQQDAAGKARPWYAHPGLRWSLGFAVLAVIAVEATLLVRQDRRLRQDDWSLVAQSEMRVKQPVVELASEVAATADRDQTREATASPASAPATENVDGGTSGRERIDLAQVTADFNATQRAITPQAPPSDTNESTARSESWTAQEPAPSMLAAGSTVAESRREAAPGAGTERESVAEETVAELGADLEQIAPAPAAHPPVMIARVEDPAPAVMSNVMRHGFTNEDAVARQEAHRSDRPASQMMLQVNLPQRPQAQSTERQRIQLSVPESSRGTALSPRQAFVPAPPTVNIVPVLKPKDVEIALVKAGGEIVDRKKVRETPATWQILAELRPEDMTLFLNRLEGLGLQQVFGNGERVSRSRPGWILMEGDGWLLFDDKPATRSRTVAMPLGAGPKKVQLQLEVIQIE